MTKSLADGVIFAGNPACMIEFIDRYRVLSYWLIASDFYKNSGGVSCIC